MATFGCGLVAAIAWAQPPALDAALRDRIDAFVEQERQASGIPGIALAIVQLGSPAHARGFGEDGRGKAISGDTPFQPLQMTHSYTDHDAGRQAGMTAVHRLWFGVPVAHQVGLPPGFALAGSLVSSAGDMSRYLTMLLADGESPGPVGRVVSQQGVAQLLAPAAPVRRFKLGATDFEFRYGEGWLVGPFGAAADARWHQGALAAFEAWMVLLPDTRQAVALLINAKCDLPVNGLNAVSSRLPIGVVNLLRGQPPPQGPSLQQAYLPFNVACAISAVALLALSGWAARARRMAGSVLLLGLAIAVVVALWVSGLNAKMLSAFAPDVALVVAVALVLLCLPAVLRAGAWARRALTGTRGRPP